MGDKVMFNKMDVDVNFEMVSNFGIMSILILLVKKDGEVVDILVGYYFKE